MVELAQLFLQLKKIKKVIAVPRLHEFGEHVNNHQKEIVKDFNDKGYIIGIENVEQLKDAILKAKEFEPVKYKHNNEKMLKIIQEFIDKQKDKEEKNRQGKKGRPQFPKEEVE